MSLARKPLIHENKTRARLLLYGLPALFLVAALAFIRYADFSRLTEASWADMDFETIESVQIFQEYLRFDTTYPNGNEIPAAEYIAGILSAEGIPVEIERLGSRYANLVATLDGYDPRALALHGHVDTEPVRHPEAWRFDPFGGVLEPPFIYGRGAFDMKSVTVAQVMAMLSLKRSGTTPARSVKLLLTSDEERASWLGTRRLLKVRPEWHDFWAVLTEGGAVEAVSVTEAKYWGTEFQQKRYIDIWVCDADPARLEFLRQELQGRQTGRSLDPDVARFLPWYGPTRDRPVTQDLLASPATLLERLRTYPVDVGPTVLTPLVDSMLRSLIETFPVEADPTGGFRVRVILHLLPELQIADVWDELVGDRLNGFTYNIEEVSTSVVGSDIEHPAFRHIHELITEVYPEIPHGPIFLPFTATDARYFRQYDVPVYGFTPFHILSGDAMKMRGVDERLPAPAFVAGVELYEELVRRMVDEG